MTPRRKKTEPKPLTAAEIDRLCGLVPDAPERPDPLFPKDPLTDDEIDRLSDAFPRRDVGYRDRLTVALLYRCGLTLDEALALLPSDVSPPNRPARSIAVRGAEPREVEIDHDTIRLARRWMNRRDELGVPATAPLLCTPQGRPWSRRVARDVLLDGARRTRLRDLPAASLRAPRPTRKWAA
jgi:integrase